MTVLTKIVTGLTTSFRLIMTVMDSMKQSTVTIRIGLPRAPELPNDGIDQDCDGVDSIVPLDLDGDGFDEDEDCDDDDPTVYPGAPEVENDGIDQDCDGSDFVVPIDLDGDGFTDDVDCDDEDPNINPTAIDIHLMVLTVIATVKMQCCPITMEMVFLMCSIVMIRIRYLSGSRCR